MGKKNFRGLVSKSHLITLNLNASEPWFTLFAIPVIFLFWQVKYDHQNNNSNNKTTFIFLSLFLFSWQNEGKTCSGIRRVFPI